MSPTLKRPRVIYHRRPRDPESCILPTLKELRVIHAQGTHSHISTTPESCIMDAKSLSVTQTPPCYGDSYSLSLTLTHSHSLTRPLSLTLSLSLSHAHTLMQTPACYGAECSLGPCPSRCADDLSSLKLGSSNWGCK